jgi:hypothetical protein
MMRGRGISGGSFRLASAWAKAKAILRAMATENIRGRSVAIQLDQTER